VNNLDIETESARPLARWRAGVSTKIGEGLQAALQNGSVAAEFVACTGEHELVYVALLGERATDLRHLMAVVEVLDGLFEPNCDEQADSDGRNMDEKILPCAHGVVRWMDIEHRYCVFLVGS